VKRILEVIGQGTQERVLATVVNGGRIREYVEEWLEGRLELDGVVPRLPGPPALLPEVEADCECFTKRRIHFDPRLLSRRAPGITV
jgi:hypothetical protein